MGGEPVDELRLIPARAGSTSSPAPTVSSTRAHPRSRGEHTCQAPSAPRYAGSSPLARGARPADVRSSMPARLIPARAGSTISRRLSSRIRRAHPRSRGEHGEWVEHFPRWWGSSPLARGAQPPGSEPGDLPGLIPARAGSTTASRSRTSTAGAHPRSRGEHVILPVLGMVRDGSSPLARGAPVQQVPGPLHVGLIPARAGSTTTTVSGCSARTAHPRSRGEHSHTSTCGVMPSGSSPLARGALHRPAGRVERSGLIPARAGSTTRGGRSGCSAGAHPRSRGEHPSMMPLSTRFQGSFPLARGAR